jgi:hypothetical protein
MTRSFLARGIDFKVMANGRQDVPLTTRSSQISKVEEN